MSVAGQEAARVVEHPSFLDKTAHRAMAILAVVLAFFHVFTSITGLLPSMQQAYFHLGLVLAMVFLFKPLLQTDSGVAKASRVVDFGLALASLLVCGYVVVNFFDIAARGSGDPSELTVMLGLVATVLLLEATRRMIGWALPILALVFIVYAFIGPYLPMEIAHRGFSIRKLSSSLFVSTSGIPGTPLQVSATYVAIFVIFAAFLEKSGAGKFFIDWSYASLGRLRGGPAKVAVVGSSLMGTINGSAVANTVATGTFTIPLMKRSGMKPEVAGAVEAASSSDGQIMPPVMGAAAFIMVEMLGVPYAKIMEAAIFPAILYYLSLFLMIDFYVARQGLTGVPKHLLPDASQIFRQGWYLTLPLLMLIALLVFVGYTPIRSAFYALLATIVVSWVSREYRMGPKRVLEALQAGGRGMLEVAVACATAGIIIAVLVVSGLALRISSLLIDLSGGSLMLLMVLTMIVSLIMGMGLPTSAVYIVLATLVVPAMTELGVNPLAAHFFVLYFGVMANVTPPVALAAYAGAAIAKANANRTGVVAFRLALAGFILPFCWAYNPALVLQGSWTEIVPAVLTAVVGIVALAGAVQGYLFKQGATGLQRLLLAAGAILVILPDLATDAIGITLIGLAILLRYTLGGIPITKQQVMASSHE